MNPRTMRFPGSFLYYLFFGFYLCALALVGRASSKDRLVIERLHWTDLSAYLSWILRHVGLPHNSPVILEGRLLGIVGMVEPRMSQYLRTRYGRTFVDVGAYHGHYSLLLSRNFKQVIAIEPVPKNADFLQAVIAYRKVTNVRVVRMAAGAEEGVSQLQVMPQPSESKLVSKRIGGGFTITVPTFKLDSLLQPYDEVDLVKLDVEGAEFDVLAGATGSMSKICSLLIELHQQTDKKRLETYLLVRGYDLQWIDQGHLFASRRVTLLKKSSQNCEIFWNGNHPIVG